MGMLHQAGAFALLVIGAITLNNLASAQGVPATNGGDALWHLPKLAEKGWFIHAHNGQVRVCNVNRASIAGDRPGPQCSSWE